MLLILACGTAGCALFRPPWISIESESKLPGNTITALRNLASVQDVLDENREIDELARLTLIADEQNMVAYLRANGYFDAKVTNRITERKRRPHVVFEVNPGPAYQINEVELIWPKDHPDVVPIPTSRVGRASSSAITSPRSGVTRRLREIGFPNARSTNQLIVVDHAGRVVNSHFYMDPGPLARFGELHVDGLNRLRYSYVEKARTWKRNEIYDVRKLELMEQRLAASGLFSSIQIQRHETEVKSDEIYDVSITLRERKARAIQLGVGYRTDTGAETSAQWIHRNAFGGGENFLIRARYTEEGYEGELRLTVPFFRRSDQQWGASITYQNEKPDAYESRSLKSETWISRELDRHWLVRVGIGLQYLDETQNEISDNYFLVSLPTRLVWDRANDRLDATRGGRAIWMTEPFQGIDDTELFFWKNLVTVNGFLPLNQNQSLSLAVRLTGGAIQGTSLRSIPAEERFYAGGGQSVRGYAYQSLSPRDGDNIVGGLSLAESSLELRARIGSSLGAVVFIDGGGAFDETVPDFKDTYRWGTGAGIRYFTPVGPLRFDAGAPLNRRDGIDKSWQFYVSIGQAF